MADVFLKEKDVDDYIKKAEKKYPKGTVIDILLLDKGDDSHIIYAVEEGKKVHKKKQKKMKKADKQATEIVDGMLGGLLDSIDKIPIW